MKTHLFHLTVLICLVSCGGPGPDEQAREQARMDSIINAMLNDMDKKEAEKTIVIEADTMGQDTSLASTGDQGNL